MPDRMDPSASDGPRALLVDFSTTAGGASERGLTLLAGLPAGSAALAALDGTPVATEARARGLEVHTLGRWKWNPGIAARLARLIRARRFDVIDPQNPQAKIWSWAAARATGVALTPTVNSWPPAEFSGTIRRFPYHFIEMTIARSAPVVIVVSAEIEALVVGSGVDAARVVRIPAGIGVAPEDVTADRRALLARFGIGEPAVVFCGVGRLIEQKGFADLVSAMSRLASSHPDACCLIVGSGRMHDVLARQIGELGLAPRVLLAGGRPHADALALIKACDVFVMPSHTEGTPVALLEAAALERPIVASRVGGIPDIVESGTHALLVPAGDVAALAAALTELHDRPELRERLGRAARERVRERYSAVAMAAATRTAYRRAVTAHAASR